MPEHPQLEALPEWPTRTNAVLATMDHGPYAIPVYRQAESQVQSGIDRRWVDENEQRALQSRVEVLRGLAA